MTFNDNLAAHYANVEQSNIMNSFIKYYIDSELVALKNLLLDASPETLDTLNELAAALNDDPQFFQTVASDLALKADLAGAAFTGDVSTTGSLTSGGTISGTNLELSGNFNTNSMSVANAGTFSSSILPDGVSFAALLEAIGDALLARKTSVDVDAADAALSGRLDVLEADPTTAAAVAAVQADVDQNETDSDAADAALSGRLDVLEADPTTAAAVAAVQADVDQNETDSDAAEAALSARLDTLEADPTTAAAVAAVQADVDQNESDADAALALKAPLADPDFTGVLEVDTNARLEFDSNLTKLHNVLRGTYINIGNNIELVPAAAGGRVEVTGDFILDASDLTDAADDTAAAAAGVIVGQVYHNSGALRVRLS